MANDITMTEAETVEAALPSTLLPRPIGNTSIRRRGDVPSDVEVERTAKRLFAHIDPTAPSNVVDLVTRRLPHVYPERVLNPLNRRLAATVTNRGRLYLQGTRLGVGATTLTEDYSKAFNLRASAHRDPRRITYVPIRSGSDTPLKQLDAICLHLRAPLSTTEMRFRSTEYLARRVVAGIRALGICTIIFDHLHHASKEVLELMTELMRVSDPQNDVPFEPDEYEAMVPRLGFVLVSHNAPEAILARVPEMLHLLEGEHVELRPYTSAAVTAEAIRGSDIGLDDLDLATMEDALIAQVAHEMTSGLIDQLHPLLRLVDAVAQYNRLPRPTLETFMSALPFHRHLREKILGRADPSLDGARGQELLERAAALRDGYLEPLRVSRGTPAGDADVQKPARAGGHPKLEAIKKGRSAAEDERKSAVDRPRRRRNGQ